jgi:toxin ParE1/3/4
VNYFLSPEAEEELAQAVAFYVERASATVASAFLAEFTRIAELASAHPGLGTTTSRGRRLMPFRRFPYTLIYRVDGDAVRIGAVAHQRRRPGYWRARG